LPELAGRPALPLAPAFGRAPAVAVLDPPPPPAAAAATPPLMAAAPPEPETGAGGCVSAPLQAAKSATQPNVQA
jgi:hypothetical protein